MWTFGTRYLGAYAKSRQVFPTRKEAWEAAMRWADICYENGEVVSVEIVAVPK